MNSTSPTRPTRPTMVLLILMVIVGAAVTGTHAPALSARAMACDDQQYLVDNYLVRHPSWTSAGIFLREVLDPSTVHGYYQPLAMISLMLDTAMDGSPANLRPYHQTSLILHVANTLLIVLLLYLLFGEPWPAAVAGLLFGLHPLTVEPIPWVGERKTLLAAFFALLALIAYVRFAQTRRWSFFAGAIIGYALALLSKPTSTPLPLAMLLLDFWPFHRFGWRAVVEKIPLLAVGAASAVVTFISQDRTAATVLPTAVPLFHSLLRLCHNVIFYLEKMIWPANLSSHYAVPDPFNLSDRGLLVGLIGFIILVPVLLWSLRYTRVGATCAAIYFFLLLPTVQIVGFSDAMASDKYAYLPAVGVLIALTWLLCRWRLFSWPTRRRPVVVLVEIVLICAAASEVFATRRYLGVWKDTESLCAHMLSFTPRAAGVHNHLGLYLASRGRLDEAIAQYQEALQYGPADVKARNNLGIAYSSQGKTSEAVLCWTTTLQDFPRNFTANYNLGTLLLETGRVSEARPYLERAVQIQPSHPQALTNLATALSHNGRLDEAISHLRKSVSLWPDSANAQHNLATLLLQSGRPAEAAQALQEVLRLEPTNEAARAALESIASGASTKPS